MFIRILPFVPGTIWNVRRAIGTPQALELPAGLLERPQGSLAALVLFVGRRYYLRPIIPLELREAHNLSAEREVDAGNRSCSAIRDFLCVRVLVV